MDLDGSLLERWRAGDMSARDQLVDRHYNAILAFFRGKVGPADGDLTQDTFTTCLEVVEGFRGHSTFRTYLFGIAWNKLRAFIRSKDREFDFDTSSISQIAALATSPSGKVDQKTRVEKILEAITRLPFKQQVLLECRYALGLEPIELAEIFDQPANTISQQLIRANDAVREEHDRLYPAGPLEERTLHRVLSRLGPHATISRHARHVHGTT